MSRLRRRYYTLASLLDAQPRGLVRDSRHHLLWNHFMSSEKLQKLRISRRCYSLLNQARIKPENMKFFYRTYRLPTDPFFPLFLTVKKAWLEERQRWRDERDRAIMSGMQELPDHRRRTLRMLAELERIHHPSGANPVWDDFIFPKSKKRAGELAGFGEIEWQNLWSLFLSRLIERYGSFPESQGLRIEALLMLDFNQLPDEKRPGKREVKNKFRILSRKYHPDRGGNATLFRRLKTARDLLLNERYQTGDR